MQTFTLKWASGDGTAASAWEMPDIEWSSDATSYAASSTTHSFVSFGGYSPDPDKPRKKYDPFGAVELWAKPKRQKRPSAFVAFNQVPNERPRKGRRGRH